MAFARLAPAATFVGFALAAGVLQVLATVVLGLADVEVLRRASEEGSRLYLLGALGTGVGFVLLWVLRTKPAIAAPVFFVFELSLLLWLGDHTSLAGLAFHGEYILHHFVTLLAAAAIVSTVVRWTSATELGPSRIAAMVAASIGTLGILIGHLLAQPGISMRAPGWFADAAAAAALLAPVFALVATRQTAVRAGYWGIAVALQIPMVLRIAFAYPESLSGGSVPDSLQAPLMATAVAASAFTFTTFRPQMPRTVRMAVVALSSLATALLYLIYLRGFGRLEDGLGGLAQSLFGFSLPYPSAVAGWKIVLVALCLFFIFSSVYAGLMSWNERVRGLALGLLAITGIGISNPQLVLMAVAGHLLWLDSLRDPDALGNVAPPHAIDDVIALAAERLKLPAPTVLETSEGTVVSLRGDLAAGATSTAFDLRARPNASQSWTVVLRVGEIEHNDPLVELVPTTGPGGTRPAHSIAATHRYVGALEELDDSTLDAMACFPTAHARFWTAGAELELGADLGQLDTPQLCTLLSALGSTIARRDPPPSHPRSA